MASAVQKTTVGIFVLVGMGVMGGLIIAFGGGRTIFAKTYDLNVVFPQGMEGVQQGQTVTLSGKRIGETRDVRFLDPEHLEHGVVVVVRVEDVELPAASELVVAKNLMGLGKPLIELKVLNPDDPQKIPSDGTAQIMGRMLPPLDQLVPQKLQNTLEEATRHIGGLAAALQPVAQNLSRLLDARPMTDVDTRGLVANLDTVVQRFDAALRSFNEIVGNQENQKNFSEVLANSRRMSESGVKVMEDVKGISGQGQQFMSDATVLLRRLTSTTDDLSTVLKRLDEVLAGLTDKRGTMGLMMNDNRLYEEMLLSTKRLTKMLDDMREVLDIVRRGQLKVRL